MDSHALTVLHCSFSKLYLLCFLIYFDLFKTFWFCSYALYTLYLQIRNCVPNLITYKVWNGLVFIFLSLIIYFTFWLQPLPSSPTCPMPINFSIQRRWKRLGESSGGCLFSRVFVLFCFNFYGLTSQCYLILLALWIFNILYALPHVSTCKSFFLWDNYLESGRFYKVRFC